MSNIEIFKNLLPKLSLTRNFLSGGYSCSFEVNKKLEQNKNYQFLSEWIINSGNIFLQKELINIKGLSSNNNRLILIEGEIVVPDIEIPSSYSVEIFTEFNGKISKNNYSHKLFLKVSGVHLNQDNLVKEISELIQKSSIVKKFEITLETVKEHFFSSLGLAPIVEENLNLTIDFSSNEIKFYTVCDSLKDKNNPPVNNRIYFDILSDIFLKL